MKKLYYTKEVGLDESDSLNGLRTLSVYSIEDNKPKLQFEIECISDDLGEYFYSDEEEIQNYLNDNGMEDEEFEIIQL